MKHFIILTDEDLNDLNNNKIVQCPVRLLPSEPIPIYLTTQKGYEIDLEGLPHTLERSIKNMEEAGHRCSTCKHSRKIITEEPCSSCDIRLGNPKWEPKMDKKKAIQILTDELIHCRIHLNDKDKSPEYYAEMTELCMAYEFVLDILEKEAKD